MARYIDAELLLTDNTYEWFDDWGNYTSAGQAIVDAPTADVVEVVHGEWIEEWDSEHFVSSCVCSACRRGTCRDSLMKWIKSAYCPNCGAKMEMRGAE